MSLPDRAPVAVILAAGKGTRMKSRRPKVLFEVLGRTLVRRVVDAALEAGCSEVVVVVGHEAEQVRSSLGDVAGLVFAEQSGMQGTGQAVQDARSGANLSGRTVLVLPGDVPLIEAETLRSLLAAHCGGVTVATMLPPDPSGYGRIVRDEGGKVVGIVEHRDATEAQRGIGEVNTSIYAIDGSFLAGSDGQSGAIGELSTDNAQEEYLLTDVVAIAASRGVPTESFVIEEAGEVAGINDRAQLAELEAGLRLRIARRWMRAGVSMDDPASVRIEEACELASDVSLGAGVELRGTCRIGSGASIGRGSVLHSVVVGDEVRIEPYVVASSATIQRGALVLPFSVLRGINEKAPQLSNEQDRVAVEQGARIGPFSHLRQSSSVGPGAHVGNFVELKKTRLEDGAKANHLAYLGDARVGARSNVGAGVITCNYDGFAKHRTEIGEDAFVGTDSHLIAPLRIGKGAYIATGTTVTRDVPSDALAIGRARQENKKGYASRMREQLQRRAARQAQRSAEATKPRSQGGEES